MVELYEQLYDIQKLLWYLRAYPNEDQTEQTNLDWDIKSSVEDDSLTLCCMRKMLLLMRLMTANLNRESNFSNDKQKVFEILMKCYQEIGKLFQLDDIELNQVNSLSKVERIFNDLASCCNKKGSTETKVSPATQIVFNWNALNPRPKRKPRLCCLVSVKGRTRRSFQATPKKSELNKKLSEQICQLVRKLEKAEKQRDLELMRHKLLILKEQTQVSMAMLAKQKAEENVRDLKITLENLEKENVKLKHATNQKCLWNDRPGKPRDPSKTIAVTPKELQSGKPFNWSPMERQGNDSQASVATISNNVKESSSALKKQNPPKIVIHRQKMKNLINYLVEFLSDPNRIEFPRYIMKQPKLCPAIKSASRPPKEKKLNNEANPPDLKKCLSINSILAILKEEAERNSIGKTFGDRRRELLRWCQNKVRPYGIPMYEFSLSWKDGHALCALIHAYRPDLMDVKYTIHPYPKQTLAHGLRLAKFLGVQANFDSCNIHQSKPNFENVFNYVQDLYFCLESQRCINST